MVEKIRLGGDWTAKKWIAVVLFTAIILVFVLWGVGPSRFGDASGGVAAVVNGRTVSLAEYRTEIEQVEQNARQRFEGLPEPQRRAFTAELRRRVLDRLVLAEAVYQEANRMGILASDSEVKEQILKFPFLQENGRFVSERYQSFLKNMSLTAEDFERQIRKQIVVQKVQELFAGSAGASREEANRNRALSNQKLNLKYAEMSRDALDRLFPLPEADVVAYVEKNAAAVESFYKANLIEFTKPERYRARDLVVRVEGKRPDEEAKKLAADLRGRANKANFAALAREHSEDPGSKSKGGDLGMREKGAMAEDFERAALGLNAGEISQPVKIEGAYHLILLEEKIPSTTEALDKVRMTIGRRLLAQIKEPEILAKVNETLAKGDRKSVEDLVKKSGAKWQETGEFDLSSSVIPKLGDAKDILPAVMKRGRSLGLVPEMIALHGNHLILDVADWRETKDAKTPEIEGLERMLAFRKSEGPIEEWARDVESRASIQKNLRLVQ